MKTRQPTRLAVVMIALTVSTALPGCELQQKKSAATPAGDIVSPMLGTSTSSREGAAVPTRDAAAKLRELAIAESRAAVRGASAAPQSRDVPAPPAVEPDVLMPRRVGRDLSQLSLEEALSVIALQEDDGDDQGEATPSDSEWPPKLVVGEGLVDKTAEDEALRFYARGRDEALQRRHLAAVTYFLKALEASPNNVKILRELARSYVGIGNNSKALGTYQQILEVDPDESEALFMVALAVADRREFDTAAQMLGRRKRSGESFPHDAGAPLLADYVLALALGQLGYERASIELNRSVLDTLESRTITSMYGSRLASVYRQRGEIWRTIGDAYCRLEQFDDALRAYESCAALPSADPDALAPRVLYANLRLGRVHMAQLEMYSALESQAPAIDARLIRLCDYMRENGGDTTDLARAVLALQDERSNDSSIVRATAALLPRDRATELLRDFVARQPDNIPVVGQLLRWLATDDVPAATQFTTLIVAEKMSGPCDLDHVGAINEIVQQLFLAVARPSDAVRAARSMDRTPALAVVEARLLMLMGGLGPAWDVLENASQQWPDNSTIYQTRAELAGYLEEPALLKQIVSDWNQPLDACGYVLQSRSQRRAGLASESLTSAEAAHNLAPESAVALTELAWAHLTVALSQRVESDARLRGQDAAQYADMALAIDDTNEQTYRALTTLYGTGGPLADSTRLRETVTRLFDAEPDSRFYLQLVAEESFSRRRYEQALERALNLYETDQSDTTSLRLAVSAWRQMNRLEDASQWLKRRLDERPGDPHLLEQWAAVQLWLGRPQTALTELEQRVAADSDDYTALRLLESTCIAAGRNDRAVELGEKRLLSQPAGLRRDLELAGLYVGGNRFEEAVARLQNILAKATDASAEELTTAAVIAGRVDSSTPGRDELVLSLTESAIERRSDLPADIYRPALLVLAKRDPQSGTYDAFAQLMVDNVAPRDGAGVQAALLWQQTAQELVDAQQPWAAGQILRMRILARPAITDPAAYSVMCSMAFVADAAAGNRASASVDLLRELRDRGQLPPWSNDLTPVTYDETLYELSQIYHVVGDIDGSMEILRELINVAPNDAMALNNLGYNLIERNEVDDRVVRMIEMAHKLESEESNILDTIGWLRYKQGQFTDQGPSHEPDVADGDDEADATVPDVQLAEGALSYIERAVAMDDVPSAEALDHLGDVLWRVGENDRAAEMWRRGLDLLENRAWKTDLINTYQRLQTRIWGLVVTKPESIYDREYGPIEQRLKAKLEAVEADAPPPVAPTFEELKGNEE